MFTRVMVPRSAKSEIRVILTVFVAAQVLSIVHSAPHQRTLRLCSRSLSDAMYLVCKDRGYNEPFSYSGEEAVQPPVGPGVVHECCYSPCSYGQLEKYCKPSPEEKVVTSYNTIDEPSFRIVNLPYSSVKKMITGSAISKDNLEDATSTVGKRKGRGKEGRKHEHGGGARKKSQGKKGRRRGCRCRRRRRKRRRLGKVLGKIAIPRVPAFQVGTTSPEPIESILLLPPKKYIDIE